LLEPLDDLGRRCAGHVGVDADQPRRRLDGHRLRHGRAPVAPLRHELGVAEAVHQHHPGACDAHRIPAADLSDEERRAYDQLSTFYSRHVAYALIMATRPQTLYGLADSPVDLAAFALDHGDGTGQPGLVHRALEGRLESDLTRDDLLDNITLYWLTNTGVSAARLYWENKADFFDAKEISLPFAISVFPDELYQAPRSWAERAYPDNLIHFNQVDRGGHFAAWEQPQLFTEELRTAFRSLRT
jgi:pimeloyl-ACP methyl ester carboxylesterase